MLHQDPLLLYLSPSASTSSALPTSPAPLNTIPIYFAPTISLLFQHLFAAYPTVDPHADTVELVVLDDFLDLSERRSQQQALFVHCSS